MINLEKLKYTSDGTVIHYVPTSTVTVKNKYALGYKVEIHIKKRYF